MKTMEEYLKDKFVVVSKRNRERNYMLLYMKDYPNNFFYYNLANQTPHQVMVEFIMRYAGLVVDEDDDISEKEWEELQATFDDNNRLATLARIVKGKKSEKERNANSRNPETH